MSKHFNLDSIAFFVSLLFLISSCNNDEATPTNTSTADATNTVASTDASPATTTPPGTAAAFAGTLDELYIDRKFFDTLNRGEKMLFAHSFNTSGKVNLSGWLYKNADFDDIPNVALKYHAPTSVPYNDHTYFGNVILKSSGFNNIKRALRDTSLKFVLFIPKLVNTNYIGYDIKVYAALPLTPKPLLATAEANPSPPKID